MQTAAALARSSGGLCVGDVVVGRYLLQDVLGNGSFGVVFAAEDVDTREPVAIKTESEDCKDPQLRYEGKVLAQLRGIQGIPRVLACGKYRAANVLVMQRLGENLLQFLRRFGVPASSSGPPPSGSGGVLALPIHDVCTVALHALARLWDVHAKGFVHRDIKPENFMWDADYKTLYLIDFGLCKQVLDAETHEHIPYETRCAFVGTPCWASIRAQKGIRQSWRDDLEALMYVLLALGRGSLPWRAGVRSPSPPPVAPSPAPPIAARARRGRGVGAGAGNARGGGTGRDGDSTCVPGGHAFDGKRTMEGGVGGARTRAVVSANDRPPVPGRGPVMRVVSPSGRGNGAARAGYGRPVPGVDGGVGGGGGAFGGVAQSPIAPGPSPDAVAAAARKSRAAAVSDTLRLKQGTPIESLCDGLPSVFARTLHVARSLEYGEMPDYESLYPEWERAWRATRPI